MSLQTLGSVAPTELVKARVALHHAVQLIASAGHNLAKPEPDDSHRSLQWMPGELAFRGVELEGGFYVRVRAIEFVAELVRPNGEVLAGIELEDSPLIESLLILQAQMPVPEARRSFVFVQYDATLPDPVFISRALSLESLERRTELALHYAHAFEALKGVCDDEPNSTPIRAWPHHFDIATILPGPGKGSTIGVGLSPGDESYAEPYWYVTPSPLAPVATEKSLPKPWQWHTEGWTGMVLPMSRLFAVAADKARDSKLRATLTDCIDIGRKSIGPA
ncbi:MAG: hypothetical protein ACYC96_08770 [Fimbriimonadaceae bacterium]